MISRLEERAGDALRDAAEDKMLRLRRAIVRMILDELAHLKRSQARGDLLELCGRGVVEEQYENLNASSRESIIEAWTASLREWTRLDWGVAGQSHAPDWRGDRR